MGGGIVSTLLATIGKLWSENQRLKRELDTAHERTTELQAAAFREHRSDLRRIVGLPTSLGPGPMMLDPIRPPILVREGPSKPRGPPKRRGTAGTPPGNPGAGPVE